MDDFEEGVEAWKAGAIEEARDILRFGLEGCGDNLWIHVALGRIALERDANLRLARAHFGYALDLALRAIGRDTGALLPFEHSDNRPLYDAIDGLIEVHTKGGANGEVKALRALRARLLGSASPE